MTIERNTLDLIEHAIDKHGLKAVVDAVGVICGEKAGHILENWQDSATARAWNSEAAVILRTAAKIKVS